MPAFAEGREAPSPCHTPNGAARAFFIPAPIRWGRAGETEEGVADVGGGSVASEEIGELSQHVVSIDLRIKKMDGDKEMCSVVR